MSNTRVWIFRVLVLVGAGLMLYTWFQPWWTAYIVELDVTAVTVFPYGMELDMGGYEYWVAGAEDAMPGWFTPFMWVYLALCMVALLYSLVASSAKGISIGKIRLSLPQVLVGGVGLSFVVVVVSAVIVIAIQSGNFYDAPLQGTIFVTKSRDEASYVETGLKFAYWLACGTGLFIAILGLLRNKIIGKIK